MNPYQLSKKQDFFCAPGVTIFEVYNPWIQALLDEDKIK